MASNPSARPHILSVHVLYRGDHRSYRNSSPNHLLSSLKSIFPAAAKWSFKIEKLPKLLCSQFILQHKRFSLSYRQAVANLYTQEREKVDKDFVINFWRGGEARSHQGHCLKQAQRKHFDFKMRAECRTSLYYMGLWNLGRGANSKSFSH